MTNVDAASQCYQIQVDIARCQNLPVNGLLDLCRGIAGDFDNFPAAILPNLNLSIIHLNVDGIRAARIDQKISNRRTDNQCCPRGYRTFSKEKTREEKSEDENER